MDTLDIKDLIKYLEDLKSLRGVAAFQRFMAGNQKAIDFLHDRLSLVEPTKAVDIATVQGELIFRKKLQREFNDCEKLLFNLANKKQPVITDDNGSGIVPPPS